LRVLGVTSVAVRVVAGLALVVICRAYLARLPRHARRFDNPAVFCLVISVTLLCTYHQYYDMLLVAGAVIPASIAGTRSLLMLPVFGLAGISAGLSGNEPVAVIVDPICLLVIAVLSALVARRVSVFTQRDSRGSIDDEAAVWARLALAGPRGGPGSTSVRPLADRSR
jgi:hypothetical protein